MADGSKLKYGVNSGVLILIVAGILIALNTIGARVFTRADLTEGKEFTISDATKRVLKRLDDLVLCKVYMSQDLPEQMTILEQNVEDILREYLVYADGKLRVQYIDPGESEDRRQEAQSAGLPQLQVNVQEQDQIQIKNIFMGATLEYGGETEIIPVLDVNTLEYDMTSTIVKLTLDEKPTIGFLTGSGERDLTTDMAGINELLQEGFQTRPVNLDGGNTPVPEDVDILVIAGPTGVSERAKFEIDQYVMRGGKLFVLNDVITLNEQQGLTAVPKNSGLRDLMAFYGCEIEDALVMEHPRYSAQATFSQGFLSYLVPYPLWPRGQAGLLNPSHPITAQLESTMLPFTAPLRLTVPGDFDAEQEAEEAEADLGLGQDQPNVEGAVLVRTTERAWTQSGRYDLNPQSPEAQAAPEVGESYPLMVALNGSFRSFYDGKAVPPRTNAPEGAAADSILTMSPETQIIVAGNSNIVTNQFLQLHRPNTLLVQNSLDWMSIGDDLIEIRSRGATDRPIKELSSAAKTAVKYLNMFGVAALVILAGFIWNGARRRSRQKLVEEFSN